jgi:hypothetical protein
LRERIEEQEMAEITADATYDPQMQAWTVTIPAVSIQALGAEVAPSVPLPEEQTVWAYVRYLDDALVRAAGELFKATDVPDELRAKVGRRFAQQLHHLAKKADGWPTDALPVPNRSDWL